jgi:hypothetical protein
VVFAGDAEAVEQGLRVGLGVPSVELGKFAFQLRQLHAVGV